MSGTSGNISLVGETSELHKQHSPPNSQHHCRDDDTETLQEEQNSSVSAQLLLH